MTQRTRRAVSRQKVLPCLNEPRYLSHLLRVAGRLGGGGLWLGDDDPLLVNRLEERLDNGTVSDLSTLKKDISVITRG